jgi:hypothetical protein
MSKTGTISKKEKLKPVCQTCRSEDVRRDAWAEWDPRTQQWELSATFDAVFCENCGNDKSSLDWVPIRHSRTQDS